MMHIKQSLVCNKHLTGIHNLNCIHFLELGDINVHLDHFQCSLEEASEKKPVEKKTVRTVAEASESKSAESMLILLVRDA